MVDHLSSPYPQAWGVPELDHLSAQGTLVDNYKFFLVYCKVEGFSPHTITNYQNILPSFISFLQKKKEIHRAVDITTQHVYAYLLTFKDRVGACSYYDYFKMIKRFLSWLVEQEIIAESPAAKIKSPKIPKTVITPFTQDDIKKLLLICDHTVMGLRNRAIILMLLDTGLRLSELVSIQIDDVDYDHGIIKVMGKGARERRVRMGKDTQKALLKYLLSRKDKLPCLWISEDGAALRSVGVQKMIRRLGKRAGLKSVRCSPHTFRHTAATMALRNGAKEFEIQSLLGHSTPDMTRRYAATIKSEQAANAHKMYSPVDYLKL